MKDCLKWYLLGGITGLALLFCLGAITPQANGIYFRGGSGGDCKLLGLQAGQTAPWVEFNSPTNNYFQVSSNGITTAPAYVITGTTNQITFGGTNAAPNSATAIFWVSVQISGDTNTYRMAICQ